MRRVGLAPPSSRHRAQGDRPLRRSRACCGPVNSTTVSGRSDKASAREERFGKVGIRRVSQKTLHGSFVTYDEEALFYALASSLPRATRSCGSLALLMRYSLSGITLTSSKTPPGAY